MSLTRQQQLIIEAGTLIAGDRPTDQDKAFLARQMVQTTLPHSDPGNVPVWSRTNGPITLIIQQGYDKTGRPYGHPYGIIPSAAHVLDDHGGRAHPERPARPGRQPGRVHGRAGTGLARQGRPQRPRAAAGSDEPPVLEPHPFRDQRQPGRRD